MNYERHCLQFSFSESQIERLPEVYGHDVALSLIRQVVTRCWIVTSREKQSVAEIAAQMNSLVQEALKQLEEDLADMRGDERRNKGDSDDNCGD